MMQHHNPSFKPPTDPALYPGRSPSPPRRHVEPLSPSRPTPIEPIFNYPAINNHVDFHVRPEQPFTATPKQRNRSSSHRSGHHRTPSTIDALAEVALAQASPAYHNGYVPTYSAPAGYGQHEPPHKRARSEIFPSPMVGQYASRPATSYEQSEHAWYGGQGAQSHTGSAYDSRVEEAALLLNFRTGGWPTNHVSLAPQPSQTASVPTVPRPHANSFPQDSQHARPVELAGQAALLPPFNPQHATNPRPTLPSQQQTIDTSGSSPKRDHVLPPVFRDTAVAGPLDTRPNDIDMLDALQQTQTPPEDETSRATSVDVTMSETSESMTKAKRGLPKGKTRTSSGRKNIAEKAASKRAASRKKTPDPSKAAKLAAASIGSDWNVKPDFNRRKSFTGLGTSDRGLPAVSVEHRAQSVPRDTPMIVRPASPSKPQRRAKAVVTAETVCASCQTARETSKANPEVDEWVSCNGCKNWFHVDCAGFKRATEVRDVDKYFCSTCEPTHGKTTYVRKSTRAHASVDYSELQRGVLKTSEDDVEHHYIQPIKDGTFQFDPETFPRMRPELVTKDFFAKSGIFTEPICIPADWNPRPWLKRPRAEAPAAATTSDDSVMSDLMPDEFEYDTVPDDGQDLLDMVMPKELTVRQVCNLVGPETPLDVIDVKTQNSGAKWNLSRWADYYEEKGDDKPIRNVISLEVSKSKLGRLLRRPKIVRDIDLQDEVWPQEEKDKGKWPKVQYYCLMSVADSYTDFHIDFGGSSVYYHILKGKKTFFFIPPKAKHLKAYEEWNDSPQQNYTFLPNITKECYRVDLSEGDTMLIPSGWIHAVWTPETSLVIGGNFLTHMSFKNQFKVVEIEKANETPMKFRYPHFQKVMWYTAIKYMRDDPLPEEIKQAYYEGKIFNREAPIWADFDGEMAANDDRPGSRNARYYGQAELDGLPDLVNFIFRTVMLVLGRVEGISADRMKRVNTSIPKGFGEPLEVAKTFALWCSWKRSEDLPAWSHPDAVLPNSKDEGPPKKLSARALKEMERKEAIAAWRVAPDRQSARIKHVTGTSTTDATPNPAVATPERATSFTPSQPPSTNTYSHQPMPAMAPTVAPPMALMMNGMPAQHLSTPKTSVLGPKRVACDACRKRRIRCKHKDFVLQAIPDANMSTLPQTTPGAPFTASQEIHENITVTPPKTNHQHTADQHHVHQNGISGNGLVPGTNAYVNANIPMAMNGVAIFGEASKRGRTKACFECRKSKRRCVHDENGNVDPIKAAENPVPRGSVSSKKRSLDEDGTPVPIKKKPRPSESNGEIPPPPTFLQQHSTASQPTNPPGSSAERSSYPSHSYSMENGHQQEPHSPHEQQYSETAIDPHLFGYSEAVEHNPYPSHSYSYPAERPSLYSLPSLEQIANEVLDMNGRSHEDYQHDAEDNVHVYNPNSIASMPHGLPSDPAKPDESVDSAISLGGSETSEGRQVQKHDEGVSGTPAAQPDEEASHSLSGDDAKDGPESDSIVIHHGLPNAHLSIESSESNGSPSALTPASQTSPSAQKSNINNLPLYRPPAPLSASPEQSRRQLHVSNTVQSFANNKRKRVSISDNSRPGSSKKIRVFAGEDNQEPLQDQTSVELAKALQADDLGLLRRTSREA